MSAIERWIKHFIFRIRWMTVLFSVLMVLLIRTIIDAPATTVLIQVLRQPMHEYMARKLTKSDNKEMDWEKFCRLCNIKVITKNKQKMPNGKVMIITNDANPFSWRFVKSALKESRKEVKLYRPSHDDCDRSFLISSSESQIVYGKADLIKHAKNNMIFILRSGAYCTFRAGWEHNQRNTDFLSVLDEETTILPVYVRINYPIWWKILWWIAPRDLGKEILHTFVFDLYRNATVCVSFGNPIQPISFRKGQEGQAIAKYEDALNRAIG